MAVNRVEIKVGQVWQTRGQGPGVVLQRIGDGIYNWQVSYLNGVKKLVNDSGQVYPLRDSTYDLDQLIHYTGPAPAERFDPGLPIQPGVVEHVTLAPPPVSMCVSGYESLAEVLQRAYDQAAVGKGAQRHAQGEPFDQQVMQEGARRFGHGSLLFQAFKKSEESQRLPLDRAVAELLGAINYLAGAVIALEKEGGIR